MKKNPSEKEETKEEAKTETTEETTEPAETTEEAEVVDDVEIIDEAAPEGEASEGDMQLLRLKAEYDNFRKRTAKEKIAQRDDVLRQTALEFLPVYDNLDRALKQTCTDDAFLKGITMTMTQLQNIFTKLELEKIPSVGELFDPKFHEALARVDDDRWGDNTITEVFVEGFMHKDKVIRFAQVKVAN